MYFKVLAKVKLEGELTLEEERKVSCVREEIVADYLTKQHRFNFLKDDIKCLREEIEGHIYLVTASFGGKVSNFEFFVSNFEFGPPRQFENDRRFEYLWKEHMVSYLKKFAPDFVSKYYDRWNKEYKAYRDVLKVDIPEDARKDFDLITAKNCKIPLLDNEDTFSV